MSVKYQILFHAAPNLQQLFIDSNQTNKQIKQVILHWGPKTM